MQFQKLTTFVAVFLQSTGTFEAFRHHPMLKYKVTWDERKEHVTNEVAVVNNDVTSSTQVNGNEASVSSSTDENEATADDPEKQQQHEPSNEKAAAVTSGNSSDVTSWEEQAVVVTGSSLVAESEIATGVAAVNTNTEPERVFYHFMYKDKTRQQTQAQEDKRCPWCRLNCVKLYSLLKHLRCCHFRLSFTYHVSTTKI